VNRLFSVALTAGLMLLAHGTGSAGEGWYLLVPSLSEYDEAGGYLERYRILLDAPLAKWKHEGTYDTAEDCEAVRHARMLVETRRRAGELEDYQKLLSTNPPADALKLQRWNLERAHAQEQAMGSSLCIASDDPRLR
jgi:hypothetical protein